MPLICTDTASYESLQAVKAQVERDQKVLDLLLSVKEVYSYIESLDDMKYVPRLPYLPPLSLLQRRKRAVLDRAVRELFKLTVSCAYFIQEYAQRKSFVGRLALCLVIFVVQETSSSDANDAIYRM